MFIRNLTNLARVLGHWRWQYALSAALMLGAVAFRTLEPKVLQLAVDRVVATQTVARAPAPDAVVAWLGQWLPGPNDLKWALLALGGMYLLISLGRGGFNLASGALTAASTEHAVKALRDRLFAHLQRLPLGYYTQAPKGELIQRCTGDIDTIRNFAQNQIVELVSLSALFLFSFGLMAASHWGLALLSIATSPLLLWGSYLFFVRETKVWEAHEHEADKLNNVVSENLNGIRVVAAFANQAQEMEKFDQQNRRKLAVGIRHVGLHAWYWPLSDLLVLLQLLVSILCGGYWVLQGHLSLGELMGFYTYLLMIAWPMKQIGRTLSQVGMASVAMQRIMQVLDAQPEDYAPTPPGLAPLRGEIEFRQVSFRYTPDGPWALQNVSFHVRPGERIALIGPTGAGKSTLIHLLTRLYEPTEGQILLDGRPSTEYPREWLRRQIGFVLQKPFLFSASVADNIRYAEPAAPGEAVEAAAEAAQASSLQHILANGFATIVGEKGVMLSGGQKQRVALARTLLAMPAILVLDDVTSAVDTETEHRIFAQLQTNMQGHTVWVISHRVTAIQQAQRVLVLERGTLVQNAPPTELQHQPGYYQAIYQVQTNPETEVLVDEVRE
ncbi:MAG: ABC transporter ATP-binding protein/permease [Bernardetiaceae bacterium]|jgi:ATP-binding cassette subfamily B protein|nr:ABC transporter ATP-binding protein/permease [Bernardetiaceae bacterium]